MNRATLFSLGTNYHYLLMINYKIYINKFLISCVLLVNKAVDKFRYKVRLRGLKYGYAK